MCIDALMLVLEGKRHQLSNIFKSIWSILRFLFFMNTFLKIFLCSACVTNYKGQDCKMCSVHAYTQLYVCMCTRVGGLAQYIRVFLAESSTKREEMSSSTPASFLAMHVYAPVSSQRTLLMWTSLPLAGNRRQTRFVKGGFSFGTARSDYTVKYLTALVLIKLFASFSHILEMCLIAPEVLKCLCIVLSLH